MDVYKVSQSGSIGPVLLVGWLQPSVLPIMQSQFHIGKVKMKNVVEITRLGDGNNHS